MNTLPALPAELTIYTAGDLHRRWLTDLPALEAPLTVDASAVLEVDAPGLQLLLALRSHALLQGQTLQLERPSPALRAAAQALGVQAQLVQDDHATEPQA
jgi:anti-anti-sigma regulatory factor